MKYSLKFTEELDHGASANIKVEIEIPLDTSAYEPFYEDSLDEAMYPIGFAIKEKLNERLRHARLKSTGSIL